VSLFPAITDAIGNTIRELSEEIASNAEKEGVIEYTDADQLQYYRIKTEKLRSRRAQLGRVIKFVDVTEAEQHKQQIESEKDKLERFTGTFSHDLRNPLNVAGGNAEIIRELLDPHVGDSESYNPPSYETLETIGSATETLTRALNRIEALIEDLLVLTQGDTLITDPKPVSVKTLSEDCWTVVDTKGASLVVDNEMSINADENRLRQLVENLFRNAVEHGGDAVTITVGALDTHQGFYIEDTGSGIPEDAREDVFQSGFTTNRRGTGLGLSIVKEIGSQHGWKINLAESAEGGARFEIVVE